MTLASFFDSDALSISDLFHVLSEIDHDSAQHITVRTTRVVSSGAVLGFHRTCTRSGISVSVQFHGRSQCDSQTAETAIIMPPAIPFDSRTGDPERRVTSVRGFQTVAQILALLDSIAPATA